MQIKHVDFLIELLSACDDEILEWMGLGGHRHIAQAIFEGALQHFEDVIGQPHPLAEPDDADDEELPEIPEAPKGRVVH